MKCEQAEELISALIDDELSDQERSSVQDGPIEHTSQVRNAEPMSLQFFLKSFPCIFPSV